MSSAQNGCNTNNRRSGFLARVVKLQPVAPDGNWRKIDLAVRGVKNYRIRAKEGYFPN
jgi:hypothetical protein